MSCDIDITTGEVLQDAVDIDLPGLFDISCIRSYSTSRSKEPGVLGFGWKHNLDVWLETTAEGFKLHEGESVVEGGWDEQTPDGRPRAVREAHSVVLREQGDAMVFSRLSSDDARFFLVLRQDVYDNRLYFRYEGNQLATVTTPEGRVLTLTYWPSGLLATIAVSHQSLQPEPLTLVRYEYDGDGDLAQVTDQRGFSERYRYADHLIVTHITRLGGETYYAYDASRRCCASWQEGDRNVRRLEFDPLRRNTLVTDSYGYRILQRLDEAGRIVAQVDPLGHVTESIYDDQGRHIAMVDELGLIGEAEMFDAQRREFRDHNGAGEELIVQLDAQGRVIRRGCPAAELLEYTYDERDAISSIRTNTGYGWTLEYDGHGRLIHAVDTYGYSLNQQFPRNGFEVRLSDEVGLLESSEVDILGNVIRYASAGGFTITSDYEAQDCPVRDTLGDGRQAQYRFGAELNLLQETDPLGRTDRFQYDTFGVLVAEDDPLGGRLRYEYDREYRLARLTNKKGQQFEFEYDAVGNEIRRRFFENNEQRAIYDARGRRRVLIDAEGGMTTLDYDEDDRITRQILPNGVRQDLERDAAGRVVTIIETRLIDGVTTERRFALTYETGDAHIREDYDDRWIEFDYEADEYVMAVRDSWNGETRYRRGRRYNVEAIEEAGRTFQLSWTDSDYLSEVRYPNGMRQTFKIDSFGRLIARTMVGADGRVLAHRDLKYDTANQLTDVNDSYEGTRHFKYDLAGRLSRVTGAEEEPLELYAYDPDDNIVQSPNGSLTVGAGDQIAAANGWRYEYDACGRVRARSTASERWELDFESDDRLTRVRKNGITIATYSYDLLGRRTGKTTADGDCAFLYDGFTALRAERQGDRLVRYVYIPGLEIPLACYVGNEWFYYSFDQLGMPTEVWDDQGRLVCRLRKEAYGTDREIVDVVGAEPPLPFLFPGQYYDRETGFCYNTFRYYDPDIASYLTRDILSWEVQPNHYAYPRDPLMLTDPDGLTPKLTFECRDTKKCKWNSIPCAKHIARLKVAKLNREAQKRQLNKCKKCKRSNQRKYYNDKCGGNASGKHQIDHFHELQAGGADKCCRNLVAIPSRINNCLGKMIKGRTDRATSQVYGLKAVNKLINKGTEIATKGCTGGSCTKQQLKESYKRAPKQTCEKPQPVC